MEEAAAAVLHLVAPLVRGARRQRDVPSRVRLHVQAPVLHKRMRARERNKRALGDKGWHMAHIPHDATSRNSGCDFAGDVHAFKHVHVDSGVVGGGGKRVVDGRIEQDDVGI